MNIFIIFTLYYKTKKMRNSIFTLITLIGLVGYTQENLDSVNVQKTKGSMLFSCDTVIQYNKKLFVEFGHMIYPLNFYIMINHSDEVIHIYDSGILKNTLIMNKHKRVRGGYTYHCENTTSKIKIKLKYDGVLTLNYIKRDKKTLKVRGVKCIGMTIEDSLKTKGDD